jgi:hypothetical protein
MSQKFFIRLVFATNPGINRNRFNERIFKLMGQMFECTLGYTRLLSRPMFNGRNAKQLDGTEHVESKEVINVPTNICIKPEQLIFSKNE